MKSWMTYLLAGLVSSTSDVGRFLVWVYIPIGWPSWMLDVGRGTSDVS